MTDIKPNALSYWFPKLEAAGLPVPKTHLVSMPSEIWEAYLGSFDGKPFPRDTSPKPAPFDANVVLANG